MIYFGWEKVERIWTWNEIENSHEKKSGKDEYFYVYRFHDGPLI